MSFERSNGEAGYALATMMMALAALLPLGMFAVMQARLDLLIERQTRRALETFYTAEAGLEHALADLAADPRFERLLANPGEGQRRNTTLGFPFRQTPPEFFPRRPFRYEVVVEPQSSDRVDIVSYGFGPSLASRTLAASVERSALPALPAALYSAAPGIHLLLGDAFSLLGTRGAHQQPETPALAVADEETAGAVNAALERRRDAGLDPPGVHVRDFPGLEVLARAAGSAPNAHHLAGDLGGSLGAGVFVQRGALEVADASGSGFLVVDGPLRVRGHLRFSGLLIVLGDVRFDPQSRLEIEGGLLQGGDARLLHLQGRGTIRHDLAALAAVDSVTPGLLPRRARVTGWQERA